jgi:benzoate/toluate 1,2-dioxygenase beta subunit
VTAPAGQDLDLRQIERFLYREARYADEHDYDAWEALWTDDAVYWVPAGGELTEPGGQMSVIYDNRSRIGQADGDTVVGANFILAESRERGVETWAGRVTYRVRLVGGELRLAGKQVLLVNREQALPTLSFLI